MEKRQENPPGFGSGGTHKRKAKRILQNESFLRTGQDCQIDSEGLVPAEHLGLPSEERRSVTCAGGGEEVERELEREAPNIWG